MIYSSAFVFLSIVIYLGEYSTQATVFQCNTTVSCGCSRFNANINAKIVGGEIAVSHSWGWAVSLVNIFGTNVCGGSILSPSYILTAAHCFDDIVLGLVTLSAVVGADSLNGFEGHKLPLSRVFIHPSYNLITKENDIALIYLSRPINFNDSNVAKICLPSVSKSEQTKYPIVTKPVVAIGWGVLSSGGISSNFLRQVTVKTVANDARSCTNSIRNSNLQFCAAVDGGGKDTCQGDSGGPLMYYSQNEQVWVIAGITSYGYGCALPNYAGVYTRVSVYTSWIQQIVGNDGMVTVQQSTATINNISNLIIFGLILCVIERTIFD